jgi:hypothetical protein
MLNNKEIGIIKHSLGISEENLNGYRNYFNASEGSEDFKVCENLVIKGYMVKRIVSCIPGFIYHVTKKGCQYVRL